MSPRILNLWLHPKQLLALKTRATEVLCGRCRRRPSSTWP